MKSNLALIKHGMKYVGYAIALIVTRNIRDTNGQRKVIVQKNLASTQIQKIITLCIAGQKK